MFHVFRGFGLFVLASCLLVSPSRASYRGRGFDVRVLVTYRGEYLTSNSVTPALVQYQVAKTTWNWRSRYAFNRQFGVFLDVDNVFAVPLDDRFRLYRDRGDNWRNYAQKIVAGVSGRF